jgi:hypothetical protein
MKRLLVAITLALMVLPAASARAQRPPEGWTFYKTGDIAISPMMLGPIIGTGDLEGTVFALMTDFDYHVNGPVAIGALFNLGFRGGFFGLDIGPQFKYKFQVGSTSHLPYVRAGLPFRIGFPSGGDTSFGLGVVQFGGGYKYFFHRMVGAGIDIAFVPTVLLSPSTGFGFVIQLAFGIEVKL